MNKDIKFRAWQINFRKMWPHDRIKYDAAIVQHHEGHIHLMEYTGLKDKNLVEIYEGDIVSCPSGTVQDIKDVEIDGEFYKAYKPNPPIYYIVYREGYAFFLGTRNNSKYAGILNHQHNKMHFDVEVIGNIYQNPELLEEIQ